MNKEDYQKLSADEKFNFLNSELAIGKTVNEIRAALNITKEDLAKQGFYFVDGKFLRKPVRGYRTPED